MIISIYILGLVGVIAFAGMCVDLYHAFDEWQQRIHIGRWNNREQWQKAVENKARQWLVKSPVVQKTDQNRWVLWDMIRGNYSSHTIQSWQDGGLILGLSKEDAQLYVKHHPQLFSNNIEIDQAFLAFALKQQSVLEEEKESLMKKKIASYIDGNHTIPYRKVCPQIRFVDTIGLVCPFLYCIGERKLADKQIAEYDKALYQNVFPAHAFNLSVQLPMGVFDWGRGIGWYILGLILTPEGIQSQRERILHLAMNLLPFQRPQGGFSCMIFNQEERYESSGSATIGLLFVEAYKLSGDIQFLKAAFKVEGSLMKATRRNGALDYAQGDTKGIGFYSNKFSIMPFVQGISLLLSKKLDNYETIIG